MKTIFFDGDPRDGAAVSAAVAGADAVVYVGVGLSESWRRAEDLDRATRGIFVLATELARAGVRHLVLRSSLAFFSRVPQSWRLQPSWRPRPSPQLEELCPYLSELSLREVARATGLHVTVLRVGDTATEAEVAAAVEAALLVPSVAWRVQHLGELTTRPESDTGEHWRSIFAPQEPTASRALRRVAVLGAGGPIGRVVADALAERYLLRLADLFPLADAKRQSADAPVARPLPAPHEEVRLDVRDYGSVLAACSGCDAIVNLTVVRPDPVDAFLVNTLGAWNVGRAAAALGIRRVVQTGPQLLTLHNEGDYCGDFHIAGDAPTRPGRHLYGHSKFLGNEALRVLAEWHDLEVVNLMFNGFAQPGVTQAPHGPAAMMLSWDDAARAIQCALEVESLPSPYEEFHCVADFPHAQCRTDKAQRLLGWQPQDALEDLWRG